MTEIKRANGHRFKGLSDAVPHEIDPAQRPDPEDLPFRLDASLAAVLALRARIDAANSSQ